MGGLGAALLALAAGLAIEAGRAVAQRLQASPPRPIAVTPRPDDKVPPAPEPGNRPVIATTQPPAPPAPEKTAAPSTPAGRGARLSLEKIGPGPLVPGKPLRYEIVVRNSGPAPALQVRVEDRLAAGARYLGGEPRAEVEGQRLSWAVGELAPGTERRLAVELQPAGEVAETPVTVSFSLGASDPAPVAGARLTLTVTGPETAQLGEPVVLRMQITNTGAAPAVNVVLLDRLPAGLKHPGGSEVEADLGTLGPGQSKTVTLETTAIQPGRLTNEATVTADGIAPASSRTEIAVGSPVLSVRQLGPEKLPLERETELIFEASNVGTGPAAGAELSCTLPEGVQFVSAGDGGMHREADRSVAWSLGLLNAGQSRRVALRVRAMAAGGKPGQVLLRAERGLEVRSELAAAAEGVPAVQLQVADVVDPVEVGGETTYEIRLLNQGNGPALKVQVEAVADEGLMVVGADGPAAHRQEGMAVVFEPLPRLAPRADALYRVRVRALKPGDWRLKVRLASDNQTEPLQQEERTRVVRE